MEKKLNDFQILSDCHLEFYYNRGFDFAKNYPVHARNLLIAGDFMTVEGNRRTFVEVMKVLCEKFENVVYIAGNHEFYGGEMEPILDFLRIVAVGIDNLTFLDKQTCEIDGKKIAGCTLWFQDTPIAKKYRHTLNDFIQVPEIEEYIYKDCEESIEFLKQNLDSDIIMTHHLPSYKSVASRWQGQPTNCYFVCDVEYMMDEFKGTWVHGHTHDYIRYKHKDCEVICNPKGYPGEQLTPYRFGEGF